MVGGFDPFPEELERERFMAGIALFNEQRYFEAHEVWEEAWNHTYEKHKLFYQGLIQCAVAMEHLRRGNTKGARSLFRNCQKRFAPLPPVCMGVEIWELILQIARRLAPAIDPQGMAGDKEAQWPTIELKYDPFQSGEARRMRQ